MISRRAFLARAAAFAAFGAAPALAAAAQDDSSAPHVVRYTAPIAGLPRSLEGFRIGMLSDIHFGPWVTEELVVQAVRLLNEERLDLILLGGDFVGIPDGFPGNSLPVDPNPRYSKIRRSELPEQLFTRVATLLSDLRADRGVFAVYGNHDNWAGPQMCATKLRVRGVKLLQNERVQIVSGKDEIELLGCDDYWTGVPEFPKSAPLSARKVRLLLCHNPDYASYLLDSTAHEFSLALCGHTHGGQIKLPFLGALSYNVQDTRFGEGLVAHKRAQVMTSRGLGVVELPFRLNCPPEVNVVMLSGA